MSLSTHPPPRWTTQGPPAHASAAGMSSIGPGSTVPSFVPTTRPYQV